MLLGDFRFDLRTMSFAVNSLLLTTKDLTIRMDVDNRCIINRVVYNGSRPTPSFLLDATCNTNNRPPSFLDLPGVPARARSVPLSAACSGRLSVTLPHAPFLLLLLPRNLRRTTRVKLVSAKSLQWRMESSSLNLQPVEWEDSTRAPS